MIKRYSQMQEHRLDHVLVFLVGKTNLYTVRKVAEMGFTYPGVIFTLFHPPMVCIVYERTSLAQTRMVVELEHILLPMHSREFGVTVRSLREAEHRDPTDKSDCLCRRASFVLCIDTMLA